MPEIGVTVDMPENLALCGTTYALAALIDRCEAFYRTKRRALSRRTPKYANLVALHYLRMSLAAFVEFDAEIAAAGIDAGEHAPRLDLGVTDETSDGDTEDMAGGSAPTCETDIEDQGDNDDDDCDNEPERH